MPVFINNDYYGTSSNGYTTYGMGIDISTTAGAWIVFYKNGIWKGGIYSNAGTPYLSTSDKRMKTDIEDLTNSLDIVLKLKPKTFKFKDDAKTADRSIGFIAQEVSPITKYPVYAVDTKTINEQNDKYNKANDPAPLDTTYTLDYSKFGVYAIGAIQEQQSEIEILKAKITSLEEKVNQLKIN